MAKIRIYIPGFDIPKTEGVKYGDYMVIYDEEERQETRSKI